MFTFILSITVTLAQLLIIGTIKIVNIMPNIILPQSLYLLENPTLLESENENAITVNQIFAGIAVLTGAFSIGYSTINIMNYLY